MNEICSCKNFNHLLLNQFIIKTTTINNFCKLFLVLWDAFWYAMIKLCCEIPSCFKYTTLEVLLLNRRSTVMDISLHSLIVLD